MIRLRLWNLIPQTEVILPVTARRCFQIVAYDTAALGARSASRTRSVVCLLLDRYDSGFARPQWEPQGHGLSAFLHSRLVGYRASRRRPVRHERAECSGCTARFRGRGNSIPSALSAAGVVVIRALGSPFLWQGSGTVVDLQRFDLCSVLLWNLARVSESSLPRSHGVSPRRGISRLLSPHRMGANICSSSCLLYGIFPAGASGS